VKTVNIKCKIVHLLVLHELFTAVRKSNLASCYCLLSMSLGMMFIPSFVKPGHLIQALKGGRAIHKARQPH